MVSFLVCVLTSGVVPRFSFGLLSADSYFLWTHLPNLSCNIPQSLTPSPATQKSRRELQALLDPADVVLGGDRPWDIRVHDARFYRRVLAQGSLGLGESYVDGWWDSPALDELVYRVLRAGVDRAAGRSFRAVAYVLASRLINLQSRSRARIVGERHYDLGNDLFHLMLDRRMVYSCGFWKSARSLDKAQEHKLDLICRKLLLKPGQRLLDIGCGWGGLARYAAENYGVRVLGITVSREQAELAAERCEGLPVEIRLQDYRVVDERFDRVVSVGMFEHVGDRNHRDYMKTVARCLKEDGISLLHTIVTGESASTTDPWIHRYIFPNGLIPSPRQIMAAAEGLLTIEDVHGFGTYYERTLKAWHRNFSERWREIADRYGERFYRTWTYYLLSCAGAFHSRTVDLWQVVFSRNGLEGGYESIRS